MNAYIISGFDHLDQELGPPRQPHKTILQQS